jgi:hypothetical protein
LVEKIETSEEPEILKDSLGRRRYKHKYKYGKPNQEISQEEFEEALAHGFFVHPLSHKSYLAITRWIGARKTEPLEIYKEDITFEGSSLFIKIPAKKHGQRGGEIELPLSWSGVVLIKQQWEKTRPGRKLWRFSPHTAWRIIKRLWPEKTPHYLRYATVTKLRRLRDQGKITTDDIKSYTGIRRDSTIEGYGLKTQAGIHKVSKVLNEGS